MAESSATNGADMTDRLADLLYTGVGLGIIALNRAQVARRSVGTQLRTDDRDGPLGPLDALGDLLADPERARRLLVALREEIARLDDRLDGIEDHLSSIADRIEPDLPVAARELLGVVRSIAGDHAGQLRSVLGLRTA
jgi:hypothetical protein